MSTPNKEAIEGHQCAPREPDLAISTEELLGLRDPHSTHGRQREASVLNVCLLRIRQAAPWA